MRNAAAKTTSTGRRKDAAPMRAAEVTEVASPGKALKPAAVMRSERVADQVYRHLRRAIISGEIAAGARLREVEIAQALGVSRTPVREAISRLIGDLLVREHETTGVEVVDLAGDMMDIHHIREALELCAARLAAKRISDAQLQSLEDLVKSGQKASAAERVRINHQFHLTIVQASGSPRLIEMLTSFNEYFLHPNRVTRTEKKLVDQALKDHQQIVDALRARSPDRTERILRRHLKLGLMQLTDGFG
ncbi:GntR family transcriptional regulator [Xanthobacter sp. KR7-65]|uniref:GntR family transcriptional regulator n=1 Tax=Xanthobacter sp. KR7-65 TaxID=3156612 RepID=UPI0032B3D9A3